MCNDKFKRCRRRLDIFIVLRVSVFCFFGTVSKLEPIRLIRAYFETLQTEMVSPSDKRRQYVTGFTGSAGTAVVTDKLAALWVDGRYHLQADQQLDCQWTIMKSGQDKVPSIGEWLKSVLSSGDRVGADPKLVSADQWLEWRTELGRNFKIEV